MKGVFCIEGLWEDDLKRRSSVRPILELMEGTLKIPFIYRDCATREEVEFFLKKWTLKQYRKSFPILYFAMHGTEDGLLVNGTDYSLVDLATLLEDKCKNAIMEFPTKSGHGVNGYSGCSYSAGETYPSAECRRLLL
jgi:hypothetical protein